MAAAKFHQNHIVSEYPQTFIVYKKEKMTLLKWSTKTSAVWEEIKHKDSCLSGKIIG